MRTFVADRHVSAGVSLFIFIFIFFSGAGAGFSEELTAPDPFKKASSRLRDLSTFVDEHRQTVQTVSKAASNKAAASKSLSVDVSGLSRLGGNRTVANMMRLKGLESATPVLKLDFLHDHQRQLDDFSKSLRQAQKDIATLGPSAAKQRFDAIVVPIDVQEVLQLGTDGSTLPLPPHLQGLSPIRPTTLTPYVVGPGSAATVEYPAVAEIAYAWPGYGSSATCTGTLISSTAVLTAAHCFCNLVEATTAKACLSKSYKRGLEEVKATDKRFFSVFFHDRGAVPVDEIIINPQYSLPKKDLAILKLATEITNIMPAPLNTVRSLKPGEYATIVGFGTHSPLQADGSATPGPPVRASEGIKLWATIKTGACKDKQLDEHICWSYQLRNEDKILGSTCHGDSGGPAFATIDGEVTLVGVTSGGPDDCRAGADQSYDVDVFRNIAWITAVAGSNKNPAFAANPRAFVSNPASRAYGAPYHLFINRPDQSINNFFVPSSVASLSISVNTTPTFASLTLEAIAPGSENAACTTSGSDAFATCAIASPQSGTWKVRVTGASPQESQVVAAVRY